MEYELRHFDTPVLSFSANPQEADSQYRITWVNEEKLHLLPWGLELNPKGLKEWVAHRTIPKNRAFVSTFLARNGLSTNRPLGILVLCKGLSLNDCYWVVERGSKDSFEKVNLYENPMSRLLAQVAFTGYGSSPKNGFSSSPEFTTNGALPKCWRRVNGKVYLYKGGTTGFANSGMEPYSEYLASIVANKLDINHIDYELHVWKKTLCSVCELFTSKEYSFVSAASLVKSGGFAGVCSFYDELGSDYMQALSDMVAFDAIICNTDRHMNNFGFLMESKDNSIVAPAPLFDHGNSLFYQAFGQDWSSNDALEAYIESQDPCMYDDFIETARELMTRETRKKVRRLLEFDFGFSKLRKFPANRLRMIERQIQIRAQMLIG